MERYLKAVENAGLNVTDTNTATGTYTAEANTPRGVLRIYGSMNGEAWIKEVKLSLAKKTSQLIWQINRLHSRW